MDNTELQHHGIKGMRWGIRRTPEQLGRRPSGNRSRTDSGSGSKSRESRSDSENRPKKISEMSDEELQKAIRRAQLEKQYRDLNPRQVSLGEKVMKEVLAPALTQTSKQLVQEYATKKGKEILGLNPKTEGDLTALRKQVEKLNLEKQYRDLTTPKDTSLQNLKDDVARLTNEKALAKLMEERAEREKK